MQTQIYTIDITPPAAPTLSDVPGNNNNQLGWIFTNAQPVTVSGTTDAGTTVQVFDGSTLLGDATVSGTTFSFDASLAEEFHEIYARATDTAGNIGPFSNYVDIFVDRTPPIVDYVNWNYDYLMCYGDSNGIGVFQVCPVNIEVGIFDSGSGLGLNPDTVNTGTLSFQPNGNVPFPPSVISITLPSRVLLQDLQP